MTDNLPIIIAMLGFGFAGFILGVLACAHYSAPEGYEDERGFHYGHKPKDKE